MKHVMAFAGILTLGLALGGCGSTQKMVEKASATQNTAILKESLVNLNGAFSTHKMSEGITEVTTADEIIKPHVNYLGVNETSSLDNGAVACGDDGITCLKMHNGSLLAYATNQMFDTVAETHFLNFTLDPDADGPEQAVTLLLLGNGMVGTGSQAGTVTQGSGGLPIITTDPAYAAALD